MQAIRCQSRRNLRGKSISCFDGILFQGAVKSGCVESLHYPEYPNNGRQDILGCIESQQTIGIMSSIGLIGMNGRGGGRVCVSPRDLNHRFSKVVKLFLKPLFTNFNGKPPQCERVYASGFGRAEQGYHTQPKASNSGFGPSNGSPARGSRWFRMGSLWPILSINEKIRDFLIGIVLRIMMVTLAVCGLNFPRLLLGVVFGTIPVR